ncbi:hypothetical protein BBJ28_00001178 [Nothophytophthora sp. Chile5]|nr:hypothetical protein BBJ28_00001178 [Nothophytophthora sp. Chile5]
MIAIKEESSAVDVESSAEDAKTKPRTCVKCGTTFATAKVLKKHLNSSSPCDQQPDEAEGGSQKKGKKKVPLTTTCSKCGVTFMSRLGLRVHLSRVTPCDQQQQGPGAKPARASHSKTCPKCQKTFTTTQGLRLHLHRVVPCENEKPAVARLEGKSEEQLKALTCPKCGKILTTRQALKGHLRKRKPCDRPERPPPSPSRELEPKKQKRAKPATPKYHDEHYNRVARLQRVQEDSGLLFDEENENVATPTIVTSSHQRRKRSGEDGSTELMVARENKRLFSDIPPASELPAQHSRLQLEQHPKIASTISYSHVMSDDADVDAADSTLPATCPAPICSSTGEHGGDLLTGGCCCSMCVRTWASALLGRIQQLTGEVVMLRGQVTNDRDLHTATVINGTASDDRSTQSATIAATSPMHDSTPMKVPARFTSSKANNAPARMDAVDSNSASDMAVKYAVVGVHGETTEDVASNNAAGVPSAVLHARDQASPTSQSAGHSSHVWARDSRSSSSNEADCEQAWSADNQSAASQSYHETRVDSQGADILARRRLIDGYNHLNGQVLLNEKTAMDSLAHAKVMMAFDAAGATRFHRQIDELHALIEDQKRQRNAAVAALIAHDWSGRQDDLDSFTGTLTRVIKPRMEQSIHERCSGIVAELAKREQTLAQLSKRIELLSEASPGAVAISSRARYEELGGLSSRVATELDGKERLEQERREALVFLSKHHHGIRAFLKARLLQNGQRPTETD